MRTQTFTMRFLKWKKHWWMNKLNNRYFTKYLVIACIWAGYSLYTSCTPNSGIGANVLPKGTINASFIDTSTVQTSIIMEDSAQTNNQSLYLLGSYNDPVFGPTKASVYTQLVLPGGNANPFYGAGYISTNTQSVILDSAVLNLSYTTGATGNYFGDVGPQTVQVYLMDSGFVAADPYYSSSVRPYHKLLGERTIIPNFTAYDSVYYPAKPKTLVAYYNPRMRIKLDHQWAQSWVDTGLSAYTGPLKGGLNDTVVLSEAAFVRHMSGIYITVNNPMQFPGQGSILYTDLYAYGTSVVFYCRVINNNGGVIDTNYTLPSFNINTGCKSFNHYDHNYLSTPFYVPHAKHTIVSSPNNVYVQGLGGVITKIKIPYIMNWINKGPIIVNRAEVEIPVETQDIGNYSPPSQMYLIGINDTSTVLSTSTFTLPDQYTTYYGGTYDAFNHKYVFDIAEYVQNVLDKKTIDAGFYLVAGSSAISPNRVAAYGGAMRPGYGSDKRLRFKMYYTQLKP
jgi:hypothetical protein